MEDIDKDRERGKAAPTARPAWVDEQAADDSEAGYPRRERTVRRPVPGKHEDDGLWLHVLETGGGLAVLTWIAAVIIPHAVPLWMISVAAAVITAVSWGTALSLTGSAAMAAYLGTWGLMLTGWITAARLASPWRGTVVFALVLPVLALTPIGVAVIRKFRDRVNRVVETGRDSANVRECRYWEGLLARLDVPSVTVRDVIKVDGGYQVHCRLAKAAEGRRVAALPDAETARRICVHKRLATGAVYIEDEPLGGSAADFIIHVRSATGPRLARMLPAENHLLSVNREFALGVLDTGREFMLKLREVVVFICGVRGSGKALDVRTPIATPSGWTTMGEIQTGDQVFDEAGRPCRVLAVTDVMHGRPCYEIEFSDGTVITADAQHQWKVDTDASRRSDRSSLRREGPSQDVRAVACVLSGPRCSPSGTLVARGLCANHYEAEKRAGRRDQWPLQGGDCSQEHLRKRPEILTTEQMIPGLRMLNRSGVTVDGGVNNYSVRIAAPLRCQEAEFAVPPYVLGCWLGDGHSACSRITSADPEIMTEIEAEGETTWIVPSTAEMSAPAYTVGGLQVRLRAIGVLGNKHIPVGYLRASENQRRALLAGLLDTDGTCDAHGSVEFSNSNERLARDTYHLICSLGYKASIRSRTARLNGKDCRIAWTVQFTPAEKVFRLTRKLARQVTSVRSTAAHRYVIDIRPVPSVPVKCIQVDSPSKLYLAGESCVPTHNSTLLNVFIAQLVRMPDALVFMIDLKGGQEARAWLMPWLQGWTAKPAIDWLATTREEASIMLDALWRAGTARAESGKYGRKLRPSRDAPAIIVICDETAVMTGHFLREDGISNAKLAVRLLQIAETFRSVAIDPVVAAVRAVVDVTGNSGLKAMSEVRIGMRVSTAEEGRAIFPDNYAAAKQLAQLKERGQGIPKVGAELYPPVHFYNITDGNPDDDGHPTEDRITPIVLAAAERRPEPEQLVKDAMGEAYENRWEQPHIKQLLASWREDAGVPDRPAPRRQPAFEGEGFGEGFGQPAASPASDRDLFDDIVRQDELLRDMDPGLVDDNEPGHRLHPARKRLYEMLIEAGYRGRQAGVLWTMLGNEGLTVTRQTVHEWLRQAGQKGYVRQIGKPQSGRSRWMWILPEGREFDIPGMHE